MARDYLKIPIVDTARRCGLVLNSRTLRRTEVEASCPFCGDHGPGKYHLSLNTDRDLYRCNLCGVSGNSVTLYAQLNHVSNQEAYRELKKGSKIYQLPHQPVPQNPEQEPAPLERRHEVYSEMLSFLTLSDHHRANLRERGLSDDRIEENGYRSMPETPEGRRFLADILQVRHDLSGIPGFYISKGSFTLAGPNGFLIPVKDPMGYIQGFKIRLDDEANPSRKYRWLSSRGLKGGVRSYSWIHVTGDRSRKTAFLTEGPLKGDVASFLAQDAMFLCTGGVNAIKGLRETILGVGVTEVVEAMDMDQMTNVHVRNAIMTMRKEIQTIPHLKYTKYTWNPAFKGVDDYFLSRVAVM